MFIISYMCNKLFKKQIKIDKTHDELMKQNDKRQKREINEDNYFITTCDYVENIVEIQNNECNNDDNTKKQIIKDAIYHNICDMKILRQDEIDDITKMSHMSLLEVLVLIIKMNNHMIEYINNEEYHTNYSEKL